MGIMNFLRERMGRILAIVIGVALAAFIVGEVARSGSSFMRDASNQVGEVSGEKIKYDEFSKKIDQNTKQFQQQSGQSLSPQITNYIQESTWNQSVSEIILKNEIEKLGIVVGAAEARSMIQGNNPNQQIVQAFGDPKTGQVDRARLNMFLNDINTTKDVARKEQWEGFVDGLIQSKKTEKYLSIVSNGLYVNSLDAKDDHEAKSKLVNFKYAQLDYASLPDDKVTLTDDDYNTYYNEHKSLFKNKQELRSFQYVSVNAAPSVEDSVAAKKQIDDLAAKFKTSANDSLFVQVNADTKAPLVYQRKGQLDPKLDSVMFTLPNGTVYGPYLSNGSYKIAKLINSKTTFDSVKTRHILIDVAAAGGEQKAIAKADSIKKLIQGGKPFADMVKMYSSDKGSAEKGGDIPPFDFNGIMVGVQGQIASEYYNAAFKAKPGDLLVVRSQFGVHLINVLNQKGSSKVVEVAVVDKALSPSSKTNAAAYSKAQAFLGSIKGDNFAAEAKKAGLEVKKAEDVRPLDSSLPGLDNAREVVKWVFNADKGDVPEQVYSVGNQFVVPELTAIKPEGMLTVDMVKKQIEGDVRLMVKGRKLSEKLQAAINGSSNIDQVAQKAGVQAVPVENIVFANPVIPGLSPEYKVVGTLFGLGVNKLSKPIIGQHGVYVVSVSGFVNPAPLTDAARIKQQLGQALAQRSQSQVFEALKDKANVKDNRAKFY